MKKILIYLFTIILGASIPIYFLLIWEPLKSEEAFNDNTINNLGNEATYLDENNESINKSSNIETIALKQNNASNSIFNYLDNDNKERLNNIMKKLSILDWIKVNDYFSDKDNIDEIKKGIELVKIRMNSSDYQEFKTIIEKQIEPGIL